MKKRKNKTNFVVSGLLDYLTETGQTKLLQKVTEELANLLQESKKADVIIVTSSINLSDKQIENIKNILYKFLDVELPVVNEIDKKFLGGFTVKVGDWFMDASLLHQVKNLKKLMLS